MWKMEKSLKKKKKAILAKSVKNTDEQNKNNDYDGYAEETKQHTGQRIRNRQAVQ